MRENSKRNHLAWIIPIWIGVLGTVFTLIFQSLGPGFIVGLFKHNLQYNYKIVSSKISDNRDGEKRFNVVCQIRNTGEDSLSDIVISARSYNPHISDISVASGSRLEKMPSTKSEAFFERALKLQDKLLPGQSRFVEFPLIFRGNHKDLDILARKIEQNVNSVPKDLGLTFEVYSKETRGIYNEILGRYTGTNYKPKVTKFVKAIGYVFIKIAIWIMGPLIAIFLVIRFLIGYVSRKLVAFLRKN